MIRKPVRLADYLVRDAVIPELNVDRSDLAIRELVSALCSILRLGADVVDSITGEILKHELQGTTALGSGFALPHLKHPAVPRVVIGVGRSKQGLPFGALDHNPVRLFALTLSPLPSSPEYTDALAGLLGRFQDRHARGRLLNAATQDDLIAALLDDELPDNAKGPRS